MKRLDERANAVQWRLRAMKRLWSAEAEPEMPFLDREPPEGGSVGQIDYPLAATEVDGETLNIGGWVAFESGPTARVEIWLDNRSLGRARLGIPRADVEEMNDLPHAAVAGFEMTADLSQALAEGATGAATLRMVATAADGRSYEAERVPIVLAPPPPAPEPSSPPPPVVPGTANGGQGRRLLVATHQLNLGGAQLYLMDLLRGLLDRGGFAPTVVSAMDGSLRGELEAMGIPVHISGVFPMEDLSAHLGRVEELTAWARPHEFELAFVNTATALSFPGAEVAARLGIPAVWAIHESFAPSIIWAPLDPEVRALGEEALSGAAFAVFEAEATQRIFEPLLDDERGRNIPYGLDLAPIAAKRESFDNAAARREAVIPADAELLVCIGTVEPRKAQIPLAQAFELIAARHPHAQLAFVGGKSTDPHSVALEECIAASPHSSQMRLIPITPDVDPWYGMADVLVCASDIESLPRTVLEAMAWETPVLATSVFGLPELITDGETGWLCEPRDLKQLAAGVDRFLSTPAEERRRIGRASRELVEQRHDLGTYAERIGSLLEQAAKDKESGGQSSVATS
ncbi:MAG TPA: glycosyltransferase family 4 protein [Solirubrobacterales bacterium]|nr:glycosyltransferase family 4 protein [Solirubrobacterales bacterium]